MGILIINFIAGILVFWLCFPFLSILFAGIRNRKITDKSLTNQQKFACIITVYKDIDIAWPLVRSLLKQHYPHYHIFLLADCLEEPVSVPEETDQKLSLLIPQQPLNSKVASINYVLQQLDDSFTHAVIFDPDNLVPVHFLSAIAQGHDHGYEIVQGKRIAKNIDTTYAALDALGEYYYDYTVRNVSFRLGSSSTLAGSGMSIALPVYKLNIASEMLNLQKHGVVVAEDKSLQLEFVKSKKIIAYAPAAVIFDEKTTSGYQVSRQRTRWLNSYFKHSTDALKLLFAGISKLNWNIIYFAVMVLFPPLSILVVSVVFVLLILFWANMQMFFILLAAALLFSLTFLLALLLNRTPGKVIAAIPQIPLFMSKQMAGLLNMKQANKDFMVTSHEYKAEITDIWQSREAEFKNWKIKNS
ncbi:MAG: glycosyltransferase [Lacibacter sp.]